MRVRLWGGGGREREGRRRSEGGGRKRRREGHRPAGLPGLFGGHLVLQNDDPRIYRIEY